MIAKEIVIVNHEEQKAICINMENVEDLSTVELIELIGKLCRAKDSIQHSIENIEGLINK